jgi:integrase
VPIRALGARATFEHTCVNNWFWFRAGIRRLTNYAPLATAKLDEITYEKLAGFAAYEQTRSQNHEKAKEEEKCGLAVSSINSAIRVLRRVMNLAILPAELHRERVITPDEEMRYLAAASPLLADVGTVLADTGMRRPDECYQLRWESVTWGNGRNGTLLVTHARLQRLAVYSR